MSKPYLGQLIAICELLDKSQPDTDQKAYDLLNKLWLEHKDNRDFNLELNQIYKKHPKLFEELQARCQTASYTPKIFISYSHKDESFKNELITMLAGLQRRGIIDTWQDRRIEAGDEWLDAIRKAMKECNMAVLLVSPDFIESRFVQEEELARLFQRRIEEGLRVVPIIIRPCLWQSEPVIKDLQALPKDAKPVISFSKDNGDRDQVWAEIGMAIENLAKSL